MAIVLHSSEISVPSNLDEATWDEGSQCFLIITPISLFIFGKHTSLHSSPQEIRLSEGPKIQSAKVSPNYGLLALQRTPYHIQFVDARSDRTFVQGPQHGNKEIVGIAWTKILQDTIIIVTISGIEVYKVSVEHQSLKEIYHAKHTTSWWKYSHECGLLLLGSSKDTWVQAFQVTSKGVLRLSPFQLHLPKDPQSQGDQSPNLIDTKCLRILKLYNKVFIGLIDKANGILSLHRVFRDGIALQKKINLNYFDLLVSDNLIIMHDQSFSNAAVFDNEDLEEGLIWEGSLDIFHKQESSKSRFEGDQIYSFYTPNLVHHIPLKELLDCRVDIKILTKNLASPSRALAFVMRRSQNLYPVSLPDLSLKIIKGAIWRQVDPGDLQNLFDFLHKFQNTENKDGIILHTELTAQRICKEIFMQMRETHSSTNYLQVAVIIYRASASKLAISLPLMLHLLYFEMALQLEWHQQVTLELTCNHELDSTMLASQLQKSPNLPSSIQLADDMLQRLDDIESYCQSLIKQQKVVPALRIARQHNILNKILNEHVLDLAEQQGPWAYLAAHRLFEAMH